MSPDPAVALDAGLSRIEWQAEDVPAEGDDDQPDGAADERSGQP